MENALVEQNFYKLQTFIYFFKCGLRKSYYN